MRVSLSFVVIGLLLLACVLHVSTPWGGVALAQEGDGAADTPAMVVGSTGAPVTDAPATDAPVTDDPAATGDDDVNPAAALFVVLLFGAIVLLVVLFVGLVIAGCAMVAVLMVITFAAAMAAAAAGVVSTSTLAGISYHSAGTGVSALLSQVGALLGLPVGLAAGWLAHALVRAEGLDVARWLSVVLGGVSGAAAGAVVGVVLAAALRWGGGRLRAVLTRRGP